ncbi:MAG TPA: hypothetical protein VM889_09980 [Candidatus Thermoplasmatota archaeon]|nr:hypothetical protein [Candidatus Thermoplasmatota archaeon]
MTRSGGALADRVASGWIEEAAVRESASAFAAEGASTRRNPSIAWPAASVGRADDIATLHPSDAASDSAGASGPLPTFESLKRRNVVAPGATTGSATGSNESASAGAWTNRSARRVSLSGFPSPDAVARATSTCAPARAASARKVVLNVDEEREATNIR